MAFHDIDISSKELKALMKPIKYEEDVNKVYKKIQEIEQCLGDMKPTKCEFKYQKYFALLFQKIKCIPNDNWRIACYINIYIQLLIVFPELSNEINIYNKHNYLLETIKSANHEKKQYYWKLYTNDFEFFEHIEAKELVNIYTYFFKIKIKDCISFYNFLPVLGNMVIALCSKFNNGKIEKITTKENNGVPYIFQIIESFIDICIFFSIQNKDNESINNKRPISVFRLILPTYFELCKNKNYKHPILSFKIICLYCIIYALFLKENLYADKLFEFFSFNIDENLHIFFALFLHQSKQSLIINKLKQPLYLPFLHFIIEKNMDINSSIDTFIENSILKEYDNIMSKIDITESLLIFGKRLFQYEPLIKRIDAYNHLYSELLSGVALIANRENYYRQIIEFLYAFVAINPSNCLYKEITLILKIMNVVMKEVIKTDRNVLTYFYPIVYFIVKTREQFIFQNETLMNILCSQLLIFLEYRELLSSQFTSLLIDFSLLSIQKNYNQFLEPLLLVVFSTKEESINTKNENHSQDKKNEIKEDEVFINCSPFTLFKIKKRKNTNHIINLSFLSERNAITKSLNELKNKFNDLNISNNYSTDVAEMNPKEFLILIQNLIKKINENEIDIIVKIISKHYSFIFQEIIKESNDSLTSLFVNCIVVLVNSSLNNYQDIIKSIFQLQKTDITGNNFDIQKGIKTMMVFCNILSKLLIITNNRENKMIFSYLLQKSINKRIITEYYNSVDVIQCKTKPLLLVIISSIKEFSEDKICFYSFSENSICYGKKEHLPLDNSSVYFDIGSIFANCIYHLGLWSEYPNINEYREKYVDDSYKIDFLQSDTLYIYNNINKILTYYSLIPREHITHLIKVLCHIIKKNMKTIEDNFFFQIITIFSKIIYLLKDEDKDAITDKKVIIATLLDFFYQQKDILKLPPYLSLALISFSLNSLFDNSIEEMIKTKKSFTDVHQLILILINIPEHPLNYVLVVSILFLLKDILQYSSKHQLMNYIYILLVISRRSDTIIINNNLQKFISINVFKKEYYKELDNFPFIQYFGDILCLYYLSYLNKKKENDVFLFFQAVKKTIKESNNTERNLIFEYMLLMIINEKKGKRSNINIGEVVNSIEQWKFISVKNNCILLLKDNECLKITPISNNSYCALMTMKYKKENAVLSKEDKLNRVSSLYGYSQKEKTTPNNEEIEYESLSDNLMKDFYIERNQKQIDKINQIVSIILKTPVYITYHVNLFFYPKEYNKLLSDNLLNQTDPDDLSPEYLTFISQLGNVYINDNNEKVLAYRDSFYNIIFELVNLKPTIEEKKTLIKDNRINMIWIDNPYINTSSINTLFDWASNKDYIYITITPKSNTHCMVNVTCNKDKEKYKLSHNLINVLSKFSIDNIICSNYYINLNAYSSIRYIINSIILFSDWWNYLKEDSLMKKMKDNKNLIQVKTGGYCFLYRLLLIKKLCEDKSI